MSYSHVADHRRMLFDNHRNAAYARALGPCIGPDTVVMDLGAGLGIHGLLAAAVGARRVYLVEPEPVAAAALEAARASGLADRIVVVRQRIAQVQLPEKVDVIVSALTGNLLFTEDLLPALFHARDHHLKPGGRMVPDRAELWLAPWEAKDLHDEYVARWQRPVMGLDYAFAGACAANELVWPSTDELRGSAGLSEGARLVEVDLVTAADAHCKGRARAAIVRSGLCHGLLGWIRMRLGEEWLSSSPDAPPVHWSPALLPIDPPLPVERGDSIEMTLDRPLHGEWTWTVSGPAGSRRHSTFLARPEGPREFATVAPATAPGISAQGRRTLAILQMMAQGSSNSDTAATLVRDHGLDAQEALAEVQSLARRYGDTA